MERTGGRRRLSPAAGDRPVVLGVAAIAWGVLLVVLAAQSDSLAEFGFESGRRGAVRYLGGSAVLATLAAWCLRATRPSHFGPLRTLIATLLFTTSATVAGVLTRNLYSAQGLSSNGAVIEAVGAIVGALFGIGVSLVTDPLIRRWWRGVVALSTASLAIGVVAVIAIVDAGPVGRTAASCGNAYDDDRPDAGYARRFDLTTRTPDGEIDGLTLDGDVTATDTGLQLTGGQARSAELGREISLAAISADQITISAWIVPADLFQEGPARIVTISGGISRGDVNVHLGQLGDTISFRVRTRCDLFNWVNTNPVLDGSSTPRHVVATYAGGRARVWMDTELVLDQDIGAGALDNWDPDFPLVFGNEADGSRPWDGELLDVGVYGYELTQEEIGLINQAGY